MERIPLEVKNYSGLLNIERSFKLYCLEHIRKTNWGYEGILKIAGINFQCIVKVGKDYIDILETSGKLSLHISFSSNGIEISCDGVSKFLIKLIASRISRLLMEYGKYFNSSKKNSVLFKENGEKVIDLRGVYCPYGEVSIVNILNKVEVGHSIEILSDCVAASNVFPKIAEELGFKYEIFNLGDHASYIFLRYRKTEIKEPNLSEAKQGIRDFNYLASLFLYFNKIEKIEEYDEFYRDILEYNQSLAVLSPRGRSWFLVSYVNKKVITSRLEYEGITFFDDCVYTVLEGLKGRFTLYRLVH